jgi:mannose-6-phosphate isomerase-like protein (cupin superfamily)
MPYVRDGEALDQAVLDIEAVAAASGPGPWRACLVGTPGLRVVLLHWPPGFGTVPHLHPHAEETFEILRGRAVFSIGDGPDLEVGPGAFLLAKRGELHAIRVPDGDEPLLLLAAVAPNEDRPDETIEPG